MMTWNLGPSKTFCNLTWMKRASLRSRYLTRANSNFNLAVRLSVRTTKLSILKFLSSIYSRLISATDVSILLMDSRRLTKA